MRGIRGCRKKSPGIGRFFNNHYMFSIAETRQALRFLRTQIGQGGSHHGFQRKIPLTPQILRIPKVRVICGRYHNKA